MDWFFSVLQNFIVNDIFSLTVIFSALTAPLALLSLLPSDSETRRCRNTDLLRTDFAGPLQKHSLRFQAVSSRHLNVGRAYEKNSKSLQLPCAVRQMQLAA